MNHFNGRPIRNTASRFKGVYKKQGDDRWWVQFFLAKGKAVHLGIFETEEEACRAYDEAAQHYRGPTAFQNLRDMKAKTEPIVDGITTRVPLKSGKYFVIDTEDLDAVGKYYWHCSRNGSIGGNLGEERIALHCLLLRRRSTKTHAVVHINGDPLDCRKSNLAVIPFLLIAGRHRKMITGREHSIYKGVKRRTVTSWQARIGRAHIGTYGSEVEAALAYDDAARRKYGIFAAVNFPREGEVSCLVDQREKLAA